MTRRDHATATIMLAALAGLLTTLALTGRAPDPGARPSSSPRILTTETTSRTPSTTTDPCDADCELDTWQRAVWQATVWKNAVAANERREAEATSVPVMSHDWPPGEIEQIIREVWAGSGLEDWAVGIAWRESRHQPGVVSGEGALGLFQLLGHDDLIAEAAAALGRPNDWSDPRVNALAARYLAERSGTCHWEAPNYCAGR